MLSKQAANTLVQRKRKILKSSYWALASICYELPHNRAIFERLNKLNSGLEIYIIDFEIINKAEGSLGNSTKHSIKDILRFLIPSMISKRILNYSELILYIHISGDGKCWSQNQTFNSIESHNILHIALALLVEELHDIKARFIDNNGYK
ncbi:12654_t:CDS:2 [Gigaspora margarita]|uniref:12654_t:CDS:1 n=1 Tax=Gigaspora margarita TaxID=4874 RepID=A0ABN7V9W1_GIGMA|nr:12654_t:CDS:2 [Gigaspora margarita]